MPQLRLNDATYELPQGETRIGRGGDERAAIELAGDGPHGTLAVIDRGADGAVLARRGPDGDATTIEVNGLVLTAQPVPLMHGDRLSIDGQTLRFAADVDSGKTAFIPLTPADVLGWKGPERRRAPNSGGRLVSQVDGREYEIGERLRIGREASNDVVLSAKDVSRRHAEIVLGEHGYEIRDLSSNGVFVNGERARSGRALVRGDVLRLGREELRFHADPLPAVLPDAPAPDAATADVPLSADVAPQAEEPGARATMVLWLTLFVVAAIAILFFFRGR
ncbi:MAG TPA: FHA domain-containing protein [Gemmatimonadaceae bacterium]|nr:FHA domain-containing protein [Gemmatimonadaceae bacterium]